jgi:hypothetical protein
LGSGWAEKLLCIALFSCEGGVYDREVIELVSKVSEDYGTQCVKLKLSE